MEPLGDLRLEPMPGEMPRALARRGAECWEVAGVIAEVAWAVDDATVLLASTDDIPQEDALHLSLLEPGGSVEAVTLGAAYTTGNLRVLEASGNRLVFEFFGGAPWCLTVLPAPVWRWPCTDPRGVSRTGVWKSRLRIAVLPRPGA